MTRWLSFARWACLVLLLAGAANIAAGTRDSRTATVGVTVRGSSFLIRGTAAVRETCPAAQKAVGFYRRQYTASRERMNLEGAPPREWYPCASARRRAKVWRARAHVAALELARYQREQYAWWTWMPRGSKWYRVASCETGYGRDPNWSHDSGTYVSAFGIYRPGYADDAHRIGNMSWDETIRARGTVPTPREQYEAALSHYRANGGFSGWGCRGA